MTTDEIPVGFRFRGGWLEVRSSTVGGTENFFEMSKVVFLSQIAPLGITEIFPEQLCELFGITVDGEKIPHPDAKLFATGNYFHPGHFINLSGDMTYWRSSHRMMPFKDAEAFVEKITNAFPNCILFQQKFEADYNFSRCRKIEFFLASDENIFIGIGAKPEDIEIMFQNGKAPEKKTPLDRVDAFPFCIRISFEKVRHELPLPWEKALSQVKYHRIQQVACHIAIDFKTDDIRAQNNMSKLIAVINDHFHWGHKVFDLEDGHIIFESADSPPDFHAHRMIGHSYSGLLKKWCEQDTKNYLQVGVTKPDEKHFAFAYIAQSLNKTQLLYGFKPA